MDKKYLAKIIATDNEGLQTISACCSGAKIKVKDIKYLSSNKVFLLLLKRNKIESNQKNKKLFISIDVLVIHFTTPMIILPKIFWLSSH